ncbi:sulfotransferase family 2 domain-containing protein [Cytobacillus pseudoceanisediminis]|uniref:sulfotransferase family 2 domain-containing protein n=1 Tax=Cytobacillus pseudoceanisediminis TaxID=3051614 RepID=UPI003C2CE0B9
MEKEKEIIIHTHIPKTGGMTLRSIVNKNYEKEKMLKNVFPSSLPQFKKDIIEKDNIEFVTGHHPFGLHMYTNKPCAYITMFRDPIERVISMYFYNLRKENHPLHKKVKELTFEEFINDKQLARRTVNRQIQKIVGNLNPKENDLKKAKKILSTHYKVVGITEMFDESIFLMKKELGWRDISYERKNYTTDRPTKAQFSDEIIEQIKKLNHLDIQLYNWARKKLQERLDALDSSTKQELEEFLNRNSK